MTWNDAASILRRWRKITRTTQADLAETIGVSIATISRLEQADDANPPNTREDVIYAIAQLMGRRGVDFLAALDMDGYADELMTYLETEPTADLAVEQTDIPTGFEPAFPA